MSHIKTPERCGIYTITAPSGNMYVGSSVNIPQRFKRHQNELKLSKHHNHILQNAWNKYDGQLEFKQILICLPENLLFYEQLIIDNYRPRYNIAPTAGNCLGRKHTLVSIEKMKGRVCTEVTRQKLAISSKGNKSRTGLSHTEKTKMKQSQSRKGIKYSDETIRKMSESAKLRKATPETKVKISLASSRRKHSQETKLKMRNSALKRWENSRGQ